MKVCALARPFVNLVLRRELYIISQINASMSLTYENFRHVDSFSKQFYDRRIVSRPIFELWLPA